MNVQFKFSITLCLILVFSWVIVVSADSSPGVYWITTYQSYRNIIAFNPSGEQKYQIKNDLVQSSIFQAEYSYNDYDNIIKDGEQLNQLTWVPKNIYPLTNKPIIASEENGNIIFSGAGEYLSIYNTDGDKLNVISQTDFASIYLTELQMTKFDFFAINTHGAVTASIDQYNNSGDLLRSTEIKQMDSKLYRPIFDYLGNAYFITNETTGRFLSIVDSKTGDIRKFNVDTYLSSNSFEYRLAISSFESTYIFSDNTIRGELIQKFSNKDGTRQWAKFFENKNGQPCNLKQGKVSLSGDLVLLGECKLVASDSYDADDADSFDKNHQMVLEQWDSHGNLIWRDDFSDYTDRIEPVLLNINDQNEIVIAGVIRPDFDDMNCIIAKYSPNGYPIYFREDSKRLYSFNLALPTDIKMGSDGSVYATILIANWDKSNQQIQYLGDEIEILKLNSNGKIEWKNEIDAFTEPYAYILKPSIDFDRQGDLILVYRDVIYSMDSEISGGGGVYSDEDEKSDDSGCGCSSLASDPAAALVGGMLIIGFFAMAMAVRKK